MNSNNTQRVTLLAPSLATTGQGWATKGRLMQGDDAIGLPMGSATQASDNGTPAMMNNLVTSQRRENRTRADIPLGVQGSNVTSMAEKFGDIFYVMPAVRFEFAVGRDIR